jgi:O-acetyl-ADP-ribose deacetylase (regulator of RNase III)
LKDYKSKLKEHVENNNLVNVANKAIEEKNGGLAWSILQLRSNYNYEGFEIIEPKNL